MWTRAIPMVVTLATLGILGCGSGDGTPRDPSTQRRNELPTRTDSQPGNERGAQSISREPHSKAPYTPKSAR